MKIQRIGMVPQKSPVLLAPSSRLVSCMFDDSIKVWKLARAIEEGGMDRQRLEHDSHAHLLTINCKVLK